MVTQNSPRPINDREEGARVNGKSGIYGGEEIRLADGFEASEGVVWRRCGTSLRAVRKERPSGVPTAGIEGRKGGCGP